MPVQFSRHALEKIRRRNVDTVDIYATLESPDEVFDDVEHGTKVALKKVNSKSIILVYRVETGMIKVITLYYTTKLDRLLNSKAVRGAWKKTK